MQRAMIIAATTLTLVAAAPPAWPQQPSTSAPELTSRELPAPELLAPPVLLGPARSDAVSRDCAVFRAELARNQATVPIFENGIRRRERQAADTSDVKIQLEELKGTIARNRQEMKAIDCQELATTLLPVPAVSTRPESPECAEIRIELAQYERWTLTLLENTRAWEMKVMDQKDAVKRLQALAESTNAPIDRANHESEAEGLRLMLELIAKYRRSIEDANKSIASDRIILGMPGCQMDAALLPPLALPVPARR